MAGAAGEVDPKAGAGTEAPAGAQGGEAKPPAAKQEAAPDKKPAAEAKGGEGVKEAKGGEPAKPHALKDDEEIPEDTELITLSSTALKKRLARATAAELKERFGTADTDVIKKKLARAEELEKKEEDRRVAALDKEQKATEAQKKAEDRATAAEAELAASKNERVVEKEEDRLKALATEHIKPKFWKHVARDFAEHLRETYSQKELNAGIKDRVINKWFADYVKDNPEYGKAVAEGDGKPGAKKVGLDNGADDNARPNAGGGAGVDPAKKVMRPGQPNSMTAQEAKAEMKKQGITY